MYADDVACAPDPCVPRWPPALVSRWLSLIHGGRFAGYAPLFEAHAVDGEDLLTVSELDLQSLGMENGLHRRALLLRVNALRTARTRSQESL